MGDAPSTNKDNLDLRFEPFQEPAGSYGTHRDYVKRAAPVADERFQAIRESATSAFHKFISEERCQVITFRDMSATELGRILGDYPLLTKPLMILCNVGARAIERDLGLKGLNSYKTRLKRDSANAVAGYLKPFLPDRIELDSFCTIDRLMFLDKEIRKGKGRWEKFVCDALNKAASKQKFPGSFKKRHFSVDDEDFEIDAAHPDSGPISIAVDVKRIEARRDIHKRCDEIVNKAAKFKQAFPAATFVAFIYYPFTEEHTNVSNRLRSESIDVVVFASEHVDSIQNAAINALKTKKI